MGLIAAFKRRRFKEKIKVALFKIDRYVMQADGWSWVTTLSLDVLRSTPSERIDEFSRSSNPIDCAVILWATNFRAFAARLKQEGNPFSADAFFVINVRLAEFIKANGVSNGARLAVMHIMEASLDD